MKKLVFLLVLASLAAGEKVTVDGLYPNRGKWSSALGGGLFAVNAGDSVYVAAQAANGGDSLVLVSTTSDSNVACIPTRKGPTGATSIGLVDYCWTQTVTTAADNVTLRFRGKLSGQDSLLSLISSSNLTYDTAITTTNGGCSEIPLPIALDSLCLTIEPGTVTTDSVRIGVWFGVY